MIPDRMCSRISGVASMLNRCIRRPTEASAQPEEKPEDSHCDQDSGALQVAPSFPARPVPFAVKTILAPMINQCDVPFRQLCVAFGADVVYTQMLLACDVVRDAGTGLKATRAAHFSPMGEGAPLVVQIAGDSPDVMATAASALAPHCAAVCVNLGCPLDSAKANHYGGWLCK